MISENKKIIYTHDAAIKKWSSSFNLYQAKIQLKLQISGSLALNMSFLVDCFGGYVKYIRGISKPQKYQQVWKKVKFEI